MVVSTNSRETCVYSRQSLGEQPGLLRGRTGVKQERPSPGQQGSYVNEDHCSSKRVQKQPLPLRFCDSCNNRTTSMSQKIRGKFSVFQETPKVSEIPREGEEPPNDTLNLLVARWDEGSKESFAHSCLWFKSYSHCQFLPLESEPQQLDLLNVERSMSLTLHSWRFLFGGCCCCFSPAYSALWQSTLTHSIHECPFFLNL